MGEEKASLLTKEKLYKAFLKWEQDFRAGKCLPQATMDAMTAEEAAQRSTEALYVYLAA
jgi:hypothetical protein